jgi:hypothetical protein
MGDHAGEDVPAPIRRLVAAAQAGDLRAIQGLIDYETSSLARMVGALARVDPGDRERLARAGLDDIARSARSVEGAGAPIWRLAARLAGTTRVRPADDGEAAQALDGWKVPPLPPGLAAATADEIEAMARRASAVARVFVAEAPGDATPLAVAPGSERVVIAL